MTNEEVTDLDQEAEAEQEQTNGEAPSLTDEEILETLRRERGGTVLDTLEVFGRGVAELQRVHKIPHDKGLRILEMILQYDINRRSLDQQVPFGAHPRSPEEVDAMLAGPPPTAEM